MRMILLRHGLTAANRECRYLGRTDTPLCPQGVDALRRLPADPTVGLVVTSALQRTRMTASLLFPRAEQLPLSGFDEMDFGAFEGRTADEMASDGDYRRWVAGGCLGCCPGGEGMAGFQARVAHTFTGMLACLSGAPALAMVVHGGTLMALLSLYADPPADYFSGMVHPGEGYRAVLSLREGVPVLHRLQKVRGAEAWR